MATKTVVELLDDLDGSAAEETIDFSLDGVQFEIDLNSANAGEFRELIGRYADAGRRRRRGEPPSRPRQVTAPPVRRPPTVADRAAIQKFAEANQLSIPAHRGRIAASVLDAWEQAGRPG